MIENLLRDESFVPAGVVDDLIPADFGVYAIRLRLGASLPGHYGTELELRDTPLIYVGKAERRTLRVRFLRQELRGQGHGTFFRSLGAVLGYRPIAGSLVGYVNKNNYRFALTHRESIVEWINMNLEVSWATVPQAEVRPVEAALILEHAPLVNLEGNPRRLAELTALRKLCRDIASGEPT